MESLKYIGGDLQIGGDYYNADNVELTNLDGLDSLEYIGNDLVIKYSAGFRDFTGLENLKFVGGNFNLYSDQALTSLTGLETLHSIKGNLEINMCDSLSSIASLQNLGSIGGNLHIVLTDLQGTTGLETLASVGKDLIIGGNNSLTSLEGLKGLISIGGSLMISGNDTLTNLKGIDNIEAGTIHNLQISNNKSLGICDALSICNYLSAAGSAALIENNARGCNSPDEVMEACGNVSVFPNPSSGQLTFSFYLEQDAKVDLTVYDRMGKVSITVIDESLPAGTYWISWNTGALTPGLYFYEFITGSQSSAGKFLVIK